MGVFDRLFQHDDTEDESEDVEECGYCDREFQSDELTMTETDYGSVCYECLDEHFSQCSRCDGYFLKEDMVDRSDNYSGITLLCEGCDEDLEEICDNPDDEEELDVHDE